jgi:hypothetical protein
LEERTARSPIQNAGASAGSSPQAAAPRGTTVKTTIERGDAYLAPQLYNIEIALQQFVRGPGANERIKSEGISDKPPDAGYEYVLARLRLGYFRRVRGLEDEQYILAEGQIASVSFDGLTEYKVPSVLHQPEPRLIDEVFNPGDSREGWVLLQVAEGDKKPLLVYKGKHVEGIYGIWRSIWFQLY